MNKRKMAVLLFAAGMVFAGCSGSNEDSTSSSQISSTASSEKKEETAAVKLGKDEAGSKSVLLKNSTGKEITSVRLRKADEKDFGDSLLGKDTAWKADEKAQYFFKEEDASKETSESGTDKMLIVRDAVELTFKDDAKAVVLYDFNPDDIDKEAEIHLKDNVIYLTYKNAKGESVDTFESQKAQTQTEQASEAAAATPETAAEQPVVEEAAQQPVYEEPVYEEPVYEEPVYQEPVYEEPVYQEPVVEQPVQTPTPDVGDQGSQGCLTGGDNGGVVLLP